MIQKFRIVSPDEMQNSHDYACALVMAVISLQTLEAFQVHAYKKGLLDDEETQLSNVLMGDIRRLVGLYKSQLDLAVARMPEFDQEKVLEWMKEQVKK